MDDKSVDTPRNRLLGIAMVLSATMLFSIGDTFSKTLLMTMNPVEANWMRNLVVTVFTLPFAWWRLGPRFLATRNPGFQVFRGGSVMIASVVFLYGLAILPLADCTAINFISPVLMTVLAVFILGERVGPRRWAATVVGFLGMLVIIRPGTSAFQPAAALPLFAAGLWALASVVTRRMATSERPETTISWSALVALIGTTPMIFFVWQWPTPREIGLVLVIGCFSTFAHALFVFAFERAGPSLLGPFTYAQIVWSTLLGWLTFGSIPDSWTLTGAAMIVASGVYIAHRERVRAREARLKAEAAVGP